MIDVAPELLSFLREEYDRCRDDTLEDERTTAIDRYNGEPYGDEEEGRSQVVARDTAETLDYMVISILRTIVSGERVVEFTHKNAEAAHQATETIMYLLMDEQDGYSVLHDWLKAGLLEKNAVAMTFAEPQPKKRVEGTIPAVLFDKARHIEAEETGDIDPQTETPILRVIELQEQPPKFWDAAVPSEEFYCSSDARTITEAAVKGRRVRKSVSDLVEMGYDEDDFTAVGEDSNDNVLSRARDEDRNTSFGARTGPNRRIWWHEEFVRYDANGDGIAELLYIQRTSDYKVFSVDEMDSPEDHPFEDWCPFPMQHRRIGQSLADKVMDIERIRSVLLRQSLDGIYIGNNPSTYVHEDAIGENTIEDLLTVRPGRLVRWKGTTKPEERQGHFDPSSGFTMLEFMNGERESRTGITRLNQGLDADTLNKTATGTALMQAQGQQVEEYLARNFANGLARLITKKARLLRRFGQQITVPIDGEYVQVDPRQWPEDMIARPRVGLGSGRKEQRLAFRRELIGMQAQAFEGGMRIVDEKKFYNSAKGFVADAGLGDVGEYFNDPDQLPPAEPKPDPAMAKVQAEIEAKKMELGLKQQESAAKLSLQQAEASARLDAMRQQGAAKAQIDAQKAIFEAQMDQARASFEASIAERQMQIDAMLKMEQINAQERHQARVASMAKKRPGGDLSK
jgi:hypothetical protein